MFERIANGWELAKASWRVLMLDKEMLVFPLVSGIACLIVMASFAVPLYATGYLETALEAEEGAPQDPMMYVIGFAFYFVNYFVIVFFNSALVACARIRFRGGDPTVADGFRASFARLPQIIGWAFVAATVGIILKAIEDRSKGVARFVMGLVGMAWSAGTYFVVPVIVAEKVGPIQAIKSSVGILRRSWGEALVANFGIGFIVFLCSLVCLIPAILGILSQSAVGMAIGIGVAVIMFILVALVSSALNTIVIAALYEYATDGQAPDQFDEAALGGAFVVKAE